MANKDILSQSIFSDLKRAGANDQQILEMFGVKQLDKHPDKSPQNIPQNISQNNNKNNQNNNNNVNNNIENIKKNNQLNNSKEEIENRQSEISTEILFSISSGNKEIFLSNDDVDILKRDNYPENFTKIPNVICSFLGRKNYRNFEEYQLNVPYHRIRLFNQNNNNNDEIVVSSIIIKNSSFSFLRKSLPLSSPPSTKEESKIIMGENGLALLSLSSSSCPLLYEGKRNEVMGEAKDIEDVSKKGKGFPHSGVADEEGKNIYLSAVSGENHLNFIEWPLDMSLKLRLFHLYSFDVSSNYNLNNDDDHLSFYSPSRRNRVKIEEGFKHEIKLSEKWIIIFTYNNNINNNNNNININNNGKQNNNNNNVITIYFIDRSSIPKRAEIDLNLDQILNSNQVNNDQINSYEMEAIELNSFKVDIPFDGRINDIGVGYEDGNGSNVCVSITPAGSSFHRFDRIEKSDKLRSKHHQNNNANFNSRSIYQSNFSNSLSNFAGQNSANYLHKLDEKLIGLPCSDQNADQKPNFIRHLFLDPRNPPSLQLSRDLSFDKSLKGTVGMINSRARSREGFLYLSVGGWPELDIHRTNDAANLLLPPPSRHFPSLFTADKSFLFPSPSFITGATFIPANNNNNNDNNSSSSSADPFSFTDHGYIVMGVVTEEEGRVVEEVEIFDTKEFENGPAFVIRPKSPFDLSFNFGVSNYFGASTDLSSLLLP